jgi:hypothetical protein
MHDTLRPVQGGSVVDLLAATYGLTAAQTDLILRGVASEFAWNIERSILCRGGLADVVEALQGSPAASQSASDPFHDQAIRAEGNAILARVLGSKDRSRALAARIARRAGVSQGLVRTMLPRLATIAMAGIAVRAKAALADVLAGMPPLGRLGRGSPLADLADILRRRCGVGRYGPRELPRAVRAAIAQAAGVSRGGAIGWYLRFMFARRAAALVRALARRAFSGQ